jgi:hypothetical protein
MENLRSTAFVTFWTWRDVWFESAMRTTTDIQAGCIKANTAASIRYDGFAFRTCALVRNNLRSR